MMFKNYINYLLLALSCQEVSLLHTFPLQMNCQTFLPIDKEKKTYTDTHARKKSELSQNHNYSLLVKR